MTAETVQLGFIEHSRRVLCQDPWEVGIMDDAKIMYLVQCAGGGAHDSRVARTAFRYFMIDRGSRPRTATLGRVEFICKKVTL